MPNLFHRFNKRSIPTVAPKTPRETSVGAAGVPFLVLILEYDQLVIMGVYKLPSDVEEYLPATDCINIDTIAY